jgi:hypothetical protein
MAAVQQMIEAEGRPAVFRKVGGLLFGAGMFMVFFRKSTSGLGDTWGDFALFLTVAIPAVVLYGLGMRGNLDTPPAAGAGPSGATTAYVAPWRSVYLVFGLALIPFALSRFVDWINGTPSADLNVFWIFGLVAALAIAGSRAAGATYMTLLAGVAGIIAWTALWDKIIGLGDDLGAYRWLMLLLAAIFIGLASLLRGRNDELESRRSSELVTIGGVAAVIAAGLSITDFSSLSGGFFSLSHPAKSSFFWEVVLLVVSIALIAYGSAASRTRGPAYVGAIGLFFFIVIAGLDLNSSTPHNKVIGWPLLLIVLGVAGIVAGMQQPRPARVRPASPPAGPQPTDFPPPQPPGPPPAA